MPSQRQRDPDHLSRATKLWPVYLGGALALTGYCLSVVGVQISYFQPLPDTAKHLYPAAYALSIWFWTFGLLGLCMKLWSRESAARRYIADASYWLYLIHLPIVMALQVWMSQWAWPAEIKYAMILGISIPVMLASYEIMVRYTFIGGLLNGRKRTRQKRLVAKETT